MKKLFFTFCIVFFLTGSICAQIGPIETAPRRFITIDIPGTYLLFSYDTQTNEYVLPFYSSNEYEDKIARIPLGRGEATALVSLYNLKKAVTDKVGDQFSVAGYHFTNHATENGYQYTIIDHIGPLEFTAGNYQFSPTVLDFAILTLLARDKEWELSMCEISTFEYKKYEASRYDRLHYGKTDHCFYQYTIHIPMFELTIHEYIEEKKHNAGLEQSVCDLVSKLPPAGEAWSKDDFALVWDAYQRGIIKLRPFIETLCKYQLNL